MINNELFLLRLPHEADALQLLAVKNNTNTAKLLGGNTPIYDYLKILNWIKFHNEKQDELILVIVHIKTDLIIGHVGLYNIDKVLKVAEFAILIGVDEFIGKGYGTIITRLILEYAFNELKLLKINLSLIADNIIALKLYKKIGFKEVGHKKNNLYKNNQYYDIILMEIFRNEYYK